MFRSFFIPQQREKVLSDIDLNYTFQNIKRALVDRWWKVQTGLRIFLRFCFYTKQFALSWLIYSWSEIKCSFHGKFWHFCSKAEQRIFTNLIPFSFQLEKSNLGLCLKRTQMIWHIERNGGANLMCKVWFCFKMLNHSEGFKFVLFSSPGGKLKPLRKIVMYISIKSGLPLKYTFNILPSLITAFVMTSIHRFKRV